MLVNFTSILPLTSYATNVTRSTDICHIPSSYTHTSPTASSTRKSHDRTRLRGHQAVRDRWPRSMCPAPDGWGVVLRVIRYASCVESLPSHFLVVAGYGGSDTLARRIPTAQIIDVDRVFIIGDVTSVIVD